MSSTHNQTDVNTRVMTTDIPTVMVGMSAKFVEDAQTGCVSILFIW